MTTDSGTARPSLRAPGAPHATTVVIADMPTGSHAYCDTYRDGPPILILDLGYTEIQLSIPDTRVTVEDLSIIDAMMAALTEFRTALVDGQR